MTHWCVLQNNVTWWYIVTNDHSCRSCSWPRKKKYIFECGELGVVAETITMQFDRFNGGLDSADIRYALLSDSKEVRERGKRGLKGLCKNGSQSRVPPVTRFYYCLTLYTSVHCVVRINTSNSCSVQTWRKTFDIHERTYLFIIFKCSACYTKFYNNFNFVFFSDLIDVSSIMYVCFPRWRPNQVGKNRQKTIT